MTDTTPSHVDSGKPKRTASARYTSRIAHPVREGARVNVSAHSAEALAAKVAFYRRLREDVKLGLCTPDRAALRIAEFKGKTPRRLLVEVMEDYAAAKGPTEGARIIRGALRLRIAPWFGGLALVSVTGAMLRAYADQMAAQDYSETVIADDVGFIRGAAKWAIAHGRVAADAVQLGEFTVPAGIGTPPKKRPKAKTLMELLPLVREAHRADVAAARRGNRAPDLRDRVLWLAFSMLRKGEAAAGRWSDLESTWTILRVWRQYTRGREKKRKAGDVYRLRLHPFARLVLTRQMSRLGVLHTTTLASFDLESPIWPRPTGGPRRSGDIIKRGVVKRLAIAAGMPDAEDWTTHCLRHSGAAMERHYGAYLGEVRRRGGWTSERMAAHYADGALPASAIPTPLALEETSSTPPADAELFMGALVEMDRELVRAIGESSAPPLVEKRDRDRSTIRDLRAHVKSLVGWAALARDAVGDVDRDVMPAVHRTEASERMQRAAHAAYVAAQREGLTPEACAKAKANARRRARDEWNRAIGRSRLRLRRNENAEGK